MILIVDISDEDMVLVDGEGEGLNCFAFWNTVTERFIDLNDHQVWATWDDFKRDWTEDNPGDEPTRNYRDLFTYKIKNRE